MNTIGKKITHNMRIFWLWLLVVIVSLLVWSNTQTASLTDVFDNEENLTSADILLQTDADNNTVISTLKKFNNLDNATLRISFFVDDSNQDAFQQAIESSYWFFLTNHHNMSIVTLYLPSEIQEKKDILLINNIQDEIMVDSIVLFHWESIDDITLEKKTSYKFHK